MQSEQLTEEKPEDVTPAKILALRDRTGMPLMRCKFALQEAKGDIEKAWRILYDDTMQRRRDASGSDFI